jgi:hypothetical protein
MGISQMDDKELLELAARAAHLPAFNDLSGKIDGLLIGQPNGSMLPWNPLTDDGDALRLAVKLGMLYSTSNATVEAFIRAQFADDPCAATRRAIVLAAAGIGGATKEPA